MQLYKIKNDTSIFIDENSPAKPQLKKYKVSKINLKEKYDRLMTFSVDK